MSLLHRGWIPISLVTLALPRIKGKTLLFADTLAASGVRYAAGPSVWWTKGPGATLYDEMAGENAPPVLDNCQSRLLSKE
jgi:membrane-bound inhibitor of C-type lysozyme